MNRNIREKLLKLLNNERIDDGQLFTKIKELTEIHDVQEHKFSTLMLNDLMSETLAAMENQDYEPNSIKTGFKCLDRACGGFGLGEFIVIGARPGMGKTQFLVNLAVNMSVERKVLFVSYDLTEYLVSVRFTSNITGFSAEKIMMMNMDSQEIEQIAEELKRTERKNIIISNSANNSITALKSFCKKQVEDHGVQVIMVDYLQLMTHYNYRNSRELEISYIAMQLKQIAKELNVCVIALSQLSRSVESRGGSKRPLLRDLRESGGIEQSADKVIFIYRPSYYNLSETDDGFPTEGLVELILAKNRMGGLDTVNLLHDSKFTKFQEPEIVYNQFEFSQNRINELNTEKSIENNKDNKDNLSDKMPF